MSTLFWLWIVLWVLPAVAVGAAAATEKNRDPVGWAFFALVFSWLVVGFILLILPPLPKPDDAPTRKCPRCAETIKAAAKACRFCGASFDGPPAPPPAAAPGPKVFKIDPPAP